MTGGINHDGGGCVVAGPLSDNIKSERPSPKNLAFPDPETSDGMGRVSKTRSCPPPGAVRSESFTLPALSPHQLAGLDAQRRGELAHGRGVRGPVAVLQHGDRIVRDAAVLRQLPHRQGPALAQPPQGRRVYPDPPAPPGRVNPRLDRLPRDRASIHDCPINEYKTLTKPDILRYNGRRYRESPGGAATPRGRDHGRKETTVAETSLARRPAARRTPEAGGSGRADGSTPRDEPAGRGDSAGC